MMKVENHIISKVERDFYRLEKKRDQIESPDISKMQEVEIDKKTKLYIALEASAEDALRRYSEYLRIKKRY